MLMSTESKISMRRFQEITGTRLWNDSMIRLDRSNLTKLRTSISMTSSLRSEAFEKWKIELNTKESITPRLAKDTAKESKSGKTEVGMKVSGNTTKQMAQADSFMLTAMSIQENG
jgi:hypothetical protein